MYEKNDKRRLYWLMEQYMSGKMDEATFCDEFYYSFDLEINSDKLDKDEELAFTALGQITSRFSQYDSDHELDPRAFSTKEELEEKIWQTWKTLKGSS